jgi:predicted O-linked N-acetylglucosamine transferase (SPINDLY family)
MFNSQQPRRDPALACEDAIELQLAGKLEAAERLYRELLDEEPGHAVANHCLGMLMLQTQRAAAGVSHLLVALEAQPREADYWLGYLEALLQSGRIDEAVEAAALAGKHGLTGAAFTGFQRRLAMRVETMGADAERQLSELVSQGRLAQALSVAQATTSRFPLRGLAWKVQGALLWAAGDADRALESMQSAARLLPADAETLSNLGQCLAHRHRFGEAQQWLQQALAVDPRYAGAHFRLSMAYEMQGRFKEAEASLRTALSLRGTHLTDDDTRGLSNLLYLASHDPDQDADSLFAEHRRVGDILESPWRGRWPSHAHSRDPARRLQVGFVSGDLHDHAVASFLEPILDHLAGRTGMALHAFSTSAAEDAITRRLRARFDRWDCAAALTDEALAAKITAERIDVLFDLSGHTALNRLRVFARKPAPVQVSWLGYPGTTGLRAMDYYLTSADYLTPGRFDDQFTEKLIQLHVAQPFQPGPAQVEVNPLPALGGKPLTFGSFNRCGKLNDATLDLWAALLAEIPQARLLIGGIESSDVERLLSSRFAARGIAHERLTLERRCSLERYLALHHQVDLCLDPIPYTGGTTVCHAMWMGVPTLTLDGATPAARQGASIQEAAGLHAFVARSRAEFVALGVDWSRKREELAQIRATLRRRWIQAPGRDPRLAARMLEAVLRRIWARWCRRLPAASFEVNAQDEDVPA